MNWILKNKNQSTLHRKIWQKINLWWGVVSQSRKIKTLLTVVFLLCIFCLAVHTAQAVETPTTSATDTVISANKTYSNTAATASKEPGIIESGVRAVVKALLGAVQGIVSYMFAIAATIFAVVVDPKNISGSTGILNKPAIKDVWIMVRDTLNMFFILVLLFSAFCTIFQVEKWGLKKVWLNILINALLVNFSYPIARIIIDISNVAMYYFINHLFTSTSTTVNGSSIFAMFGSVSGIGKILSPDKYAEHDLTFDFLMIIFTFILGMTLLIVAALFVVRLVALAILIMFSPIGFVGYIFPSTAEFADKWWKQLFSYSFFAPIMIFGMAIALKVAEQINMDNAAAFLANASINSTQGDASWIAKTAFYMIPIIILWAVIGLAKSAGGAGADKIVETGKSWGKKVATSPWKGVKGFSNATGLTGGVKKGWEDARKKGKLFGKDIPLLKNTKEDREAKISGGLSGGAKGWREAMEKKKGKEFTEKYKELSEKYDGDSTRELVNSINGTEINSKTAVDVAAQIHALKSDSVKKDEFETDVRSNIVNSTAHQDLMATMNDQQKEAHVKKQVATEWAKLNKKLQDAKKVMTRGEQPSGEAATANNQQQPPNEPFNDGGGI